MQSKFWDVSQNLSNKKDDILRFFVSYSIRLSYWNVLYLKFKYIYNSRASNWK